MAFRYWANKFFSLLEFLIPFAHLRYNIAVYIGILPTLMGGMKIESGFELLRFHRLSVVVGR
jgi:hypothetical protein